MKVSWEGFGNSSHSWGIVSQNISRALIKLGNQIEIHSTNGIDRFPADLLPYHRDQLGNDFDLALSYTAPHNFPHYLSHSPKNKFVIYNYDTAIDGKIPAHWCKFHQAVDKIFPSSNYSKQIFLNSKIPAEKLITIPHGINPEDFTCAPYQFRTKKSFKILNVTGQVHYRKNFKGILEAFGRAFNSKDDVALILKIVNKADKDKLEIDFKKAYKEWCLKYPRHAEVEIIYDFIPQIEALFLACQMVYSLSLAECFHIPSLQGLAAGKLVMASGMGGNTDFMNDNNSLLVSGKLVRAPKEAQYWISSPTASMFEPDINEAAEKLRYAYDNYNSLMDKFTPEIQKTVKEYTWDNAAKKILQEVKE